jgi:non-haem Fe2+, alpha-ketoglutarate-dependent halogenase
METTTSPADRPPHDAPWQDEDRAFFEKNGFLGPIKVYEPEEAREILHRIRTSNTDRSRAIFDNDVNYDRHFDVPDLATHIGQRAIIEKVRKLIGADFFCWRTEFFPKFPGSPGTEWHQVSDYQYATGSPMLRPTQALESDHLDITVWTAFTEATRENGCMKFLPGSHRKKYYDESLSTGAGREGEYRSVDAQTGFFGYNFEDFKVDPSWVPDESAAVAMEMKPGECVMFTPKCVHGSFPNSTRRTTRFAITARYVPTHVRVYPDWQSFVAHGGSFDLANYGCVLVSGEDTYRHNRVRVEDNHGRAFAHHPRPSAR